MELLNMVFTTPRILNDGHEIYARLEAGDDLADIVDQYARKFGGGEASGRMLQVLASWPPLHLEAVRAMLRWALAKLDTDDRVTIKYKGDDENPEVVTKFELRGHELLVEFAHPPTGIRAAPAGA